MTKISSAKNKLKETMKEQIPKTTLRNDLYKRVVDEECQLFEEKYLLIKPCPK
tara:strand:+ start:346 stop:504 length:159 start_codon:yes stop_codon:yes gene_type:complete